MLLQSVFAPLRSEAIRTPPGCHLAYSIAPEVRRYDRADSDIIMTDIANRTGGAVGRWIGGGGGSVMVAYRIRRQIVGDKEG